MTEQGDQTKSAGTQGHRTTPVLQLGTGGMGHLSPKRVTKAGGNGRNPGGVAGDGCGWTGRYDQQQQQQQQQQLTQTQGKRTTTISIHRILCTHLNSHTHTHTHTHTLTHTHTSTHTHLPTCRLRPLPPLILTSCRYCTSLCLSPSYRNDCTCVCC